MPQRDLISTKDLIAFAKRHGVSLGRTTRPYRALNFYIQQQLLPRRRRYWDGGVRWGFPRAAQAQLLRLRDLKRQGLRLRDIKQKFDEERERECQRLKQAPPTLGSPGEPDDRVSDYNHTYFYEKAKEARDLLGVGMIQNVRRILDEFVDLTEPAFSKGETRIQILKDAPMTAVYRVSTADSADYLCDVVTLEPWALERFYGAGWFHAVLPGDGTTAYEYELLIPDRGKLPYASCPALKKQGPTLEFMEETPFHEYAVYRVEGQKSVFLCQDSLWRVTPEALGREYGPGKFRLVLEQDKGSVQVYGLIIPQPPARRMPETQPGAHVLLSRMPLSPEMRKAPSATGRPRKAKCPGCNRTIVKPDGEATFLSTNGVRYDPRTHTFQIRCKHCKAAMTVILEP